VTIFEFESSISSLILKHSYSFIISMEKQVIILAGGKSERFGGQVPKPFVRIWGKQMGEYLGESLRNHLTNIYWICGPMLNNYDVLGEVTRWWKGGNHHIHFLNYQTRNPVESLFLGLQFFLENNLLSKDLPILVLDNDNYYDETVCKFFEPNFFSSCSAAVLTRPVRETDTPKYGFLKVQDSVVIQVKEKKRGWGETHISLGGYAFKNATLLHDTLYYTESKNLLDSLFSRTSNVTSIETLATFSIGTPEDLIETEKNCPERFGWSKTRVVVDLDNTLVTYPRVHGDYNTVVFRKEILNWLRYIQSKGAKLILSTARRSETHKGNQGKIVADIGESVLQQLNATGLVWEEIHFGKAYGDIYLDDRGYNPNTDLWQTYVGDFHLKTGFLQDSFDSILEQSKHNIRKEKIDIILKNGTLLEIEGYKYYLENIKTFNDIYFYFPKLYYFTNKSANSYELMIEYVRGIESSVLFSNDLLREREWDSIFNTLRKLHEHKLSEYTWTIEELHHQWIGKTIERVLKYSEHYAYENLRDLFERINPILEEYIKLRINDLPSSIIHGDAWLSNILFNDDNNIFFIDMRGKNSLNKLTITGDEMYDYAKIGTSIFGMDSAVFNLHDIDSEKRMKCWRMLLNKAPSQYKKYLPAMIFSLMLTALWNYSSATRLKIIMSVTKYSFLLEDTI